MSTHSFAPVAAFVDELCRAGVRHVCISPGSRSTPLAVLLAEEPRLTRYTLIDERSAAFFALGAAKALRQATAVLCTSGTAAANYLPAVVEAYHARVPLIVLTADRPPEARGLGSPQTIDQVRLYGSHVKWCEDMPVPDETDAVMRFFRTAARRAAAEAMSNPSGPVHVNCPFREPLTPPKGMMASLPDAGSFTLTPAEPARPAPAELERMVEILGRSRRGVIVCGPQEDDRFPEALVKLAARLQFPILADPLSQVRYGSHDKDLVIDAYDVFLKAPAIAARLRSDVVLRFGALPTSKTLAQYLALKAERTIFVDSAGWNDPILSVSDMVRADPTTLVRALTAHLEASTSYHPGEQDRGVDRMSTAALWRRLDDDARRSISEALTEDESLFEGRIFGELRALLPDESILFVGNSMPVRDLDTFAGSATSRFRTMGNRGANGIDGVLSSAQGAAAARSGSPVVLVIGDLSFYHDLNSLLAARKYRMNLTVVLVNNDGGGIFSFLPQAGSVAHFEELFGTPHGLDFKHAADLFGLRYARIDSWDAFRGEMRASLASHDVRILEVPSNRQTNLRRHGEIQRRTEALLAEGPALGGEAT